MNDDRVDTNESVAPTSPAACSTASGCTCSLETGTCAACRRTHRLAKGLVAVTALITAAAWLVAWLLDR